MGLLPSTLPGLVGEPGQPPSFTPGNGITVQVRSHADFSTLLAEIPRFLALQFTAQLNDTGAGTISISLDDSLWASQLADGSPASALLDYENLWQCLLDGLVVFEFLGETITEQRVDPSEQRQVTVTGPGTAACLKWGAAMPPGFPAVVFKTDSVQDSFAEVDKWGNPLLDTSVWNACSNLVWPYPSDGTTGNPLDPQSIDPASPFSPPGNTYGNESDGQVPQYIQLSGAGSAVLTALPGTTFLGTSPVDITGSSISAQVGAIYDPDKNALNGSQLTQFYLQDPGNAGNYILVGLSGTQFYAQMGDTTGSGTGSNRPATVWTKILGRYDPAGDAYWRISEFAGVFYVWTSSDGQSWSEQWKVPYQWDASAVSFFITAKYSVSLQQTATVANVNADVVTPSGTGSVFRNQPMMSIWRSLLDTAKGRGTIPQLTTITNGATDSFGNPWTDDVSVQVANGTDLYSLLQGYAAVTDSDYIMQPGFQLVVGITKGSAGVSLGTDRSQTVVLRESAKQLTKAKTRARDQIANLAAAVNADGTVVVASDAASGAKWGQREGWVQAAEQVSPASIAVVAAAAIAQARDESLSWTMSILPPNSPDALGAVAFEDFTVGDWVGSETATVNAPSAPVNPNSDLAAGNTSFWGSFGGTLTFTASPPAGGPAVWAAKMVPSGTAANAVINQATTLACPAAPGRSYQMSAWVYSAVGYTTVAGIDFINRSGAIIGSGVTQAWSVPAGAWTKITVLATAPAGAVTQRPRVTEGSTPPAGAVFYVQQMRIGQLTEGFVISPVRVVAIGIGVGPDGTVTCDVTLNSYRQWLSQQLSYLVNKFGGQFVSTLGTTALPLANGTAQRSSASAPTLGGLSGVNVG